MMALRRWMEANDIPRQRVADELGITKGHLSTLINANRTASEEQCQKALVIMDAKFAPHPKDPKRPKGVKPIKPKKKTGPKKTKASKLRPLTKFESKFITDVAKAWIAANKDASQEDFVEIVRALSIGIRR